MGTTTGMTYLVDSAELSHTVTHLTSSFRREGIQHVPTITGLGIRPADETSQVYDLPRVQAALITNSAKAPEGRCRIRVRKYLSM